MNDLGAQRTLARQRALELLYEATIKERTIDALLGELPVAPDPFTRQLLFAAQASRPRAQELISTFATDWPIDRIALIDRLIMELAIGEVLSDEAPPKAVILDEAVENAKTYSGENAPSFVNGVLAAIFDELAL
jgi:N utilization substance protein B